MKETLFVQFVVRIDMKPSLTTLGNGFSDAYSLCKDKGDFYWVESPLYRRKTESEVKQICEEITLPIKKGNVYVSASIPIQLYQSYIWATKYPNINFVVGGPATRPEYMIIKEDLPTNLYLTDESVEQHFGVDDFSSKWGIYEPNNIKLDNSYIYFTYTLDNKCYWNKCSFCIYSSLKPRIRKKMTFEFKDTFENQKKIILLYTPSFSPYNIHNIIPNLPRKNDLIYVAFLRSSKKEHKSLEYALKKSEKGFGPRTSQILFLTGLEFPSDRMLKCMNKGITTNEIIKTAEIITKYNSRLTMTMILGWNNLTGDDIGSAKNFIKKLEDTNIPGENLTIRIWRLFQFVGGKTYNGETTGVHLGPFYFGFMPGLSEKQKLLNNKIRDILLQTRFNVLDMYSGTLEKKQQYQHVRI